MHPRMRPRSALGRLETYGAHSIFSEIRQSVAAANQSVQQRAKTAVGAPRIQTLPTIDCIEECNEESQSPPEWMEKEMIIGQHRRHSLALVDNVIESLQNYCDPARSLRKDKLERQLTLEQLIKLKTAFKDLERNGNTSLDLHDFKLAVKKSTGLLGTSDGQIEKLFMKIDFQATGKIDWEQFCTFMQLNYAELEDTQLRDKKVCFNVPATIQEMPHGDNVVRVFPMQDNTLITVREDGHIYFWSTQLKLKRDKAIFEKSVKRTQWVTDFTIMTQYNKLVLATGDREIQLYELSNLEPYCQIIGLESTPLKLDYCVTDNEECLILYGDDKGCVNILLFTSIGETLRMWKKMPRPDGIMPTIGIDNAVLSPNVSFIRWKVHGEWVTQMKYYDSIKAVISASNDESTALVIGCTVGKTNVEQQMRNMKNHTKDLNGRRGKVTNGPPQKRASGDHTVFQVHKGVKTFAFCKRNSLVVTGGMDRLVRMWNIYIPGRATGILRGHTAPIFSLEISSEDNIIFSVATDNTAKIWDIQTHTCLFSTWSKISRIRGELHACQYVPYLKTLCMVTDSINLLQIKSKPVTQPHLDTSHREPILCCKYNKTFRQVVTCSEGSVIRVWDFETGKQVLEITEAHQDAAITCMTFDLTGRRLITGGRDGCLRIWNYNNGLCLHTLKKRDHLAEICDCTYVDINRNRYTVAVGWDRRINMYYDSDDDLHHVQEPKQYWHDDKVRGHHEDILCVAQKPPYLLASSSYDGEIIVWNMNAGHIQCRINTSHHFESAGMKSTDKSVSKIMFLTKRTTKLQVAASLVSNGPQGTVNFWNLLHGGKLKTSFKPSKIGTQISSLAVTNDNSLMFVSDNIGYIYVYDIKHYAKDGPETDPPRCVSHWRAHVDIITSLEVIDEEKMVLTSSIDCAVRLWSIDGQFVGTFGQAEPWEITTPASWKHPMVPFEILTDPLSMPVFAQPTHEPEDRPPKETSDIKNDITVTEEEIQEEINKKSFCHGQGKRLRHERYTITHKPLDHGGPSTFNTLQYFDLDNTPVTVERTAKSNLPMGGSSVKTAVGAPRIQTLPTVDCIEECNEESQSPPEWMEKEMIIGQHRRHSLALVDNVIESLQNYCDPARSLRKDKLERQLTLEQLIKLKTAFKGLERNGNTSLDLDDFKLAVKKSTGLLRTSDGQIEKLFMKIDFQATGKIDWEQFCTFMQLNYAELEDTQLRHKKVCFNVPATIQEMPYGDNIVRVFPMQDNMLITVREDGHIYFWSTDLKLKRDKAIFEKSVKRTQWVTDFTIMTQYNKLVLATGDREIQLYELSNLEPYCRIIGLESTPLKLDYCVTDNDECLILYGDDKGCVNILLFTSIGETLRMWKKMPRPDGIMPTIGIDNAVLSPNVSFIRWKVHGAYVTQMKYYDSIKAVISTSTDESTALVIGCTAGKTNVEQHMRNMKNHTKDLKGRRGKVTNGPPQKRASGDHTVFQVHKGVKTFAFCKRNSLVVTGGMDRLVWMWNIYLPGRATGILRGHTAPIFSLEIYSEDDLIFSVATDNTAKIWDIQTHTCLFSTWSKISRIRGELHACQYVPYLKALCMVTDSINLLQIKSKPVTQPHLDTSHREPVLCCKYNKTFRQVVTCSERSVIRVWDFETGKQVLEITEAHQDAAITCMTFDLTGRRLITGGRDGCLRIWNYNNGLCLHTLKKRDQAAEICDCTYVDINRNRYTVAVGWDRRINMYYDSDDDLHHIQEPKQYWHDDKVRGHREDILCVTQKHPNLLASSSYDGEIIVWNMNTGHIESRINTSHHFESAGMKSTDKSVSKILFLTKRTTKLQVVASLVSNGPQGTVNFWNILQGGKLMASFKPSMIGTQISSLAVTNDNSLMFVSDNIGYIYVYDIKHYAKDGPETDSPRCVSHWRAHVDIITSLEVIDEEKMVLTSSIDCAVRLWSIDGQFVGTFGQADPSEGSTPVQNLRDPLSKAPKIKTTHEPEDRPPRKTSDLKNDITVTEEEIQEMINKKSFCHGQGKRLRHERYTITHKPLDHGGPSTFNTLQYFDLDIKPVIVKRTAKLNLSVDRSSRTACMIASSHTLA